MAKKLMFALENEEITVTEEIPAEQMLEGAAETEVAHAEVVETTEDVAELQETIEEGIEAGETLNGLAELVEPKVAEGEGLAPETAAAVEVAIESIRTRLGIRGKLGKMPALENFKSPRASKEATRIALEASIKDTAKAIWEKIKAFVASIWEKIKTFVGNLIKNYSTLEQHLTGLRSKVEASTGELEAQELEKANLAKFFGMGGEANAESAFKAIEIVGSFSSVAEKVIATAQAGIDGVAGAQEAAAGTMKDVTAIFKGLSVGEKTEGGSTVFGPLPGNTSIKLSQNEDGSVDLEFEAGKEAGSKVKALTKENAVALLDQAIAEAKKGPQLKKVVDASGKVVASVSKAADKVLKQIEKLGAKEAGEGEEKPKQSEYSKASKQVGSYAKIVGKVGAKLPALHFATLKNSGDYVTASLANFKKAGKKEEPKAE